VPSKQPSTNLPKRPAALATNERLFGFLERRAAVLAIALVLIGSARIVATYTVFSHTSDEPAHIGCGMQWLDQGIYRFEPQHPPLARVAAALGPYLAGIRSQGTADVDLFSKSNEGLRILYFGHHYDRNLALSRAGILPFFWIACLVVYAWGAKYFDRATGVMSVFLLSMLPPVLAHGSLSTTDMALTAFLPASFLTGLLWMESPSRRTACWFGAASGLMVLSKFSCLAFLPASAAAALVWYVTAKRPPMKELVDGIRQRLPSLAIAVLVACLLIWAGYRFSWGKYGPAPELWAGIQQVKEHNAEGHLGYLLGERRMGGFWYFFEVALAVKTPLAFLVLLVIGMVLAVRRRSEARWWTPLAFAGGILLVGALSRINIGLRHVLPVYIAFSVIAAGAAIHMLRRRSWMQAALAALVLWLCSSSGLSHPDYLAYFNELAGSEPERILVDSDLDWGQDYKRLAARLRQVGASEVAFLPTVIIDLQNEQHGFPKVQGMDVQQPSHGWNAIGATCWKELRSGLGERYPEVTPWTDRIPPQERVGKSILLWYFP